MASTPRAFSSGISALTVLGFVAEFEAGNANRRDEARGALQGQADEGDRNAVEARGFRKAGNTVLPLLFSNVLAAR